MVILIACGLLVTIILGCEVQIHYIRKNGVVQEVVPSEFSPDHMNVVTRIFVGGENVRNFCELVPNHSVKWMALERIKSAKKLCKVLKNEK